YFLAPNTWSSTFAGAFGGWGCRATSPTRGGVTEAISGLLPALLGAERALPFVPGGDATVGTPPATTPPGGLGPAPMVMPGGTSPEELPRPGPPEPEPLPPGPLPPAVIPGVPGAPGLPRGPAAKAPLRLPPGTGMGP